ncbi:glycerophosphodiester phosphodiesterase family protein [Subtercola endophyticus]|uniref:glycerophosphodiester phosphodiesterase family protein n=1 Tax=Subtercola endophyticus TaxID=2895559 RepID=UPI001E4F9CA0|nr:glycerophosphodiester phosphodiesterase family protein [Subtercola endophyticus]UFS60389.1 glycerophosphodiester phosphodiesterase [Subtercola endophyticus]
MSAISGGGQAVGRERSAYFAPPLPRLLAHRGLATDQAENTIAAFRAAVEAGATYVELDVHASLDGEAIVAHDENLSRLLGRDDTIAGLSAAGLAGLDLGDGSGFATLVDVLAALPDTRINIDIKSSAAAAPAAAAISAASATDRVLVTSFSGKRRRSALKLLPGVATSASAGSFLVALLAAKIGLTPVVRLALRSIDAVQVPVRAAGMTIVTPRVLRSIHAAGVEVHIWTINAPEEMTRLLDLGVDGIVTDRIDIALDLVAHRSQ